MTKPPAQPRSPASEPTAEAGGEAARRDAARKPCKPREIGGPAGPEPTRYGDWERKGRCVDF
ncbi:MAG: hypothetical protein KatS3mg121_1538 [Gammaproteobacteria bacterium]|nr:MAG: hypothetical protein KatS3mg121_1538 [Gammaproteobacteria bacterium]